MTLQSCKKNLANEPHEAKMKNKWMGPYIIVEVTDVGGI